MRGCCGFAKFAQEYEAELTVVQKRLEWLTVVLEGPEEKLIEMKAKFNKHGCADVADDDSASTAADSRDAASIARSGPCSGFEELVLFITLKDHVQQFAKCTTEDEIKETASFLSPQKKLINVLVSACKTSLSDLKFAQTQKKNQEEKAKTDKAKRDKEQQEKKRSATKLGPAALKKLNAGSHPIFSLQSHAELAINSADKFNASWNLEEPFVLRGTTATLLFDDKAQAVAQQTADFENAFDQSSLKVTDGRAQIPVPGEVAHLLLERFKAMVPATDFVMELSQIASDYKSKFPGLNDNLLAASFGIAAGHRAVAKYEVGQMPCLRVATQGMREYVFVQLRPLVMFLKSKMQDGKGQINLNTIVRWGETASDEELAMFIEACKGTDYLGVRGIVVCTVAPADILYIPPGTLSFFRVLNASDVLGFRVGILSKKQLPLFQHVVEVAGKAVSKSAQEAVLCLQSMDEDREAQKALDDVEAAQTSLASIKNKRKTYIK